MATYRFVAYDIEKSLKKTFDDADITFPQIVYWIQVIANRIRFQSYVADKSDLFTSTFSSVPVKVDSKGRKYIDLPMQIINLPNNGGIMYVTYNEETCCCNGPAFAQVQFSGVNLGQVRSLYGDDHTKPTPKNPYFYRVGDSVDGVKVNRLYFLGFECIEVDDVEVALLGTLDPTQVCNLDDQIPIPDERIQELMMEVLTLGKFISMVPEESINQGSDEANPVQQRVPNVPTINDMSNSEQQ